MYILLIKLSKSGPNGGPTGTNARVSSGKTFFPVFFRLYLVFGIHVDQYGVYSIKLSIRLYHWILSSVDCKRVLEISRFGILS